MPLSRVSIGFKDISSSLQLNPLNLDLIAIKNETAISRSIRNLILTNPGERFFNENLGSNISKSLFENIDEISSEIIQSQVENTINQYEPRVELIEVIVDPDFDNYSFNLTIVYNIVGIDVPSQQLTFALENTR
jgi:phage baseplate assembly protein W